MHIKSAYKGELRTEANHLSSGSKIFTDAPTDNHGKGQNFSPTDMVAAAFTSCMMTIMGIEANKMGFDIEGLSAETEKIMTSGPRKISKLRVTMHWQDCTLDQSQRAHLKEKALSCPVALSIDPAIKQEVTFNF